MSNDVIFRKYLISDQPACMDIFEANCPEFFAPNEKDDYHSFLDSCPEYYEICEASGIVAGAFGVVSLAPESTSLNWILIDPRKQGSGIGSRIMERVSALARSHGAESVHIAASHKSAPFFEKFGALPGKVTNHGWGPDMHRVDMELKL